ncbi:MAG: hypothetical protein IPJ65_11085 [Archangiaceae bacterium]|nr:hypothetical protein [Archangiaceae bacterium]
MSAQELGIDLSAESRVKPVVLVPPLYRVTESSGFAGVAAKVLEKLDVTSHRRLVSALEKQLGKGKVVTTEATLAAINKEGLKIPALRTAQGMAQLAKATDSAWVVFYDLNKGTLAGAVYTFVGETTGKAASVSGVQVASLSAASADELQKKISAHLVALTQAKQEEVAAPLPAPPVAEEEVTGEVDSEIAREHVEKKSIIETIDLTRPRVVVAVGAGAAVRNQLVGGDQAASLAEQRNNSTATLAVYASVHPLHFFERFRDKAYSDLFVDANWRRAFVRARATGGSIEGQTCGVVDDELQLRGNFRWRLGGMLPSIGVGVGWAQERAAYTGCDLPVVSAIYRGIDLQLRVKQPLFRDLVAFDLAFGPRVLISGPLAPKTGFSLAGEGWIEAKPVSLLFVRGGVRFFRAVMSDDVGIVTADVRAFFGLEAGVHL